VIQTSWREAVIQTSWREAVVQASGREAVVQTRGRGGGVETLIRREKETKVNNDYAKDRPTKQNT
jgi:hypothetical protein